MGKRTIFGVVTLAWVLALCALDARAQYEGEGELVQDVMVEEAIPAEDEMMLEEQVPPLQPAEMEGEEDLGMEPADEVPQQVVPQRLTPQRVVPQPMQPPRPRPERVTPRATPRRRPAPPLQPAAGVNAGAQAGAEAGAVAPSPPPNGETPSGAVSFDFREAPLYEVIESIARLTGRNFDVDPNIGSVLVTVITHDEIPPSMAYEVLESILSSRGFSMIEALDGKLIKILPTPTAVPDPNVPLRTGAQVPSEGFDDYATHIVTVEFADPTELQAALKLLGSQNARVDSYLPTRTLIITDTAEGLRRMFTFLEMADIAGNETVMEIFTLEYTRAEVIMGQLQEVLLDQNQQSGPQPNQPVRPQPTRTTRPVRPTVPGAGSEQVIGSNQEVLRMVPDERLNSLIVVATGTMMERVRDLVVRLDTPTPYEANTLHIYELLNADAEEVEQAIQPLLGSGGRRRTTGGGGAQGGQGGQGAAGGGGGGAANADVQPFEQEVQVTRYDQTNALLIVASPQDYKTLEALIARLDVPQRQVHVDAVVMDVTTTDNYNVVVDAAQITGNDGFGLTSTSNLVDVAGALRPVSDAANQIVSPGAALAGAVLGLGQGGGLTAGVFDDLEVEVNGIDVKIPFVPLLFQAIEQITDVEVLSQPSLVTVDNEEARIIVGQEVPFVTSQGRTSFDDSGNPVSLGFTGGFNQIQREDVGVQLQVTPQISEGDNVLLEIEIEISDTDAQQIGTVDLLGPTTNKTQITNKVLVKDGSTAVLAGLIRDNAVRDRTQSPVLGDLPVLGVLFRNKGNRHEKRNLVVLVTPSIIKEHTDLKRVTQYKVDAYHDTNIDQIMNAGFFKKVKKKAEQRKEHRPTFDKSEALTGRRSESSIGFSRGDIER